MSEDQERKILHPDFFTEDPEPRLIAGRCKVSGNWTFPPYLADPVSFQDEIVYECNLPTLGKGTCSISS